MDPLTKNKYLDIVDDKPDSDDDVIEIDMDSFRSVIQSKLNNYPLYYSRD